MAEGRKRFMNSNALQWTAVADNQNSVQPI